MNYIAIIKKYGNGYSAYVRDIPGCIAAAETKRETLKLFKEALKIHLEDFTKCQNRIQMLIVINVA